MADRRRRQQRTRLDDSETVEGEEVEYSSGDESDTILDAGDDGAEEESDYASAEEDERVAPAAPEEDTVQDKAISQGGTSNVDHDDRPSDLDQKGSERIVMDERAITMTNTIRVDIKAAENSVRITDRDSNDSVEIAPQSELQPSIDNVTPVQHEEVVRSEGLNANEITQDDMTLRRLSEEGQQDESGENLEAHDDNDDAKVIDLGDQEYSGEEDQEEEDVDVSDDQGDKSEMEDQQGDKKGEDVPDEERRSGDGQEEPAKKLDDDQDRKNPQFVPRSGPYYMHDSRYDDEDSKPEKKPKEKKKLWQDEDKWRHDRFIEEDQAPKSVHEIRNYYGFDIRTGDGTDIPLPVRRRGGGRGSRRGRGRGRGRGFRRREDDDNEEMNDSRPRRPVFTRKQEPPSVEDLQQEQEWPSLQQENQHVPKRTVHIRNHDAWAEQVEQQEQDSYRHRDRQRNNYRRQNENRDNDNDGYDGYERDSGYKHRGRGRGVRARGYRPGRYSQRPDNAQDEHVDENNEYEQQWGFKGRSDSQRGDRNRGRFDQDGDRSQDSYTDQQNQRNQRYRESNQRTEFNRDDYERTGRRSYDDDGYGQRCAGGDQRKGYHEVELRDGDRRRQRDGSGEHKTQWVNRNYRKPEINSNERTRQEQLGGDSESWEEGRGESPEQNVHEPEDEVNRDETSVRKPRETKAYSRDRRQRTVRQGSKETEADASQSAEVVDQEVEGLKNLVRELKMDLQGQSRDDDSWPYPGRDIQSKLETRPTIEPVGVEVPVQGPEDGQRQERYDKRERGRPKRYSSQRQRSGHEEPGPSPRDQLQRSHDRGRGYQPAHSPDFPVGIPARTPPLQPMTSPPHTGPSPNAPPHIHQTPLRGDPRARPGGPEAPPQMVHPPPPPPDVMVQHDVAMHPGMRPPAPGHLPSAAFFHTPNHPPPQLPPPPPPGQLPPPQFMGAPVMFVGHHYPVVRPQVPLQGYSVPPPNVPAPHQHTHSRPTQGPQPRPPQPPPPSQPPPPQDAAHPPTSHAQPLGPPHPGSQIVGGITYYSPELQQGMKRPPPTRRQANPLPIEAPPEERRN